MTSSPSSPSFADVRTEGGVATVTMRASGKAPRMGAAFWREMPDLFAGLDADESVRAVIVRGEGDHFSFGLDLGTMASEIQPFLADGALARERRRLLDVIGSMQRAISCVASCRKPVIAAISGWCIGGGVDLACACDVRMASRDARFSIRETRLGMVADVGTLARLPAIVGQGAARRLALTGEDFDAARAKELGFVTDVAETPADVVAQARELAAAIAKSSPLAVQGTKSVLNAASEKAAEESLRTVALWNAAFLASHDLREAMAAFLEKRDPHFEGR
jgi:enoyl-CoA hydratase